MRYLRNRFGVQHVDAITEPGPNRILADQAPEALVQSIRARVDISVQKHGSKAIAVVGHEDCAGNPAAKDEQLAHLQAAAGHLQAWHPQAQVIRMWVDLAGQVEEIC